MLTVEQTEINHKEAGNGEFLKFCKPIFLIPQLSDCRLCTLDGYEPGVLGIRILGQRMDRYIRIIRAMDVPYKAR